MLDKIDELLKEVQGFTSTNKDEIEQFRIKFNGKKGILNDFFEKFKEVPNEQKKEFGQKINTLKQAVNTKLEELKEATSSQIIIEKEDLTKPAFPLELGSRHPINLVKGRIIEIFKSIGFAVSDGPEIEDDWHNFTALNLPEYHPARDMADTFYNKDYTLLRTHTSPVQIRTMLSQKAPIRMIAPGTVFRRDFDITHTPMFHQIEALVVDDADKISFANLKHVLVEFLQHMFGEVDVRFRPSYFPFTEPSAEVDISCVFCKGDGCRVCSQTGWLEVLGCGVVDQNVFDAVGYKDKSGYAFGLGIERFAMLIHSIGDLRSLFESDTRLLGQFK